MEVAVDRTAKVLANQLCGLEIELEAADQIDVESVEIGEQRLESEPAPLRHTAAQSLAASLIALIVECDAIVGMRDLDGRRSRRDVLQMRDEISRLRRKVTSNLENGNEFPIGRQRRVERAKRVSDPAPFFNRRVTRVAAVNHVPHEAAHHSHTFPCGHGPAEVVRSSQLQLTELLLFERCDRTDDAGGESKLAGDDLARLPCRLERAASYLCS